MIKQHAIFLIGGAACLPVTFNITRNGTLMLSAMIVILDGGREIAAGWATVYAIAAASGCFAIALSQWKMSEQTNSPLLKVDTKNWFVDGILSVAVAVAFLIAILLSDSKFAHLAPYADPSVVIILVLLSLPIPVKIVRDNWNQIVGRAPEASFRDRAAEAVQSALSDATVVETKIRMQQLGRLTYVQLYVLCGGKEVYGLKDFDDCRRDVAAALAGAFDHLSLDVIFTRDPQWVSASVRAPIVDGSTNEGAPQA